MAKRYGMREFSVLHVENLRPDYARTLEHWLKRFEELANEVSAMFGPEFARTWQLYLARAIAGFRVGTLQLFQIVFARAACECIPSTRSHLYREEHAEGQEASTSVDSYLLHVGPAKD